MCQEEFEALRWYLIRGQRRFYSTRCANDQKHHLATQEADCRVCGTTFRYKPPHYGIYCSFDCVTKYKDGKVNLNCEFCGNPFITYKSQVAKGGGKYCSTKCSGRGKSGANCHLWNGGTSYEPYSPEFNAYLKEDIRERDEYKCGLCGADEDSQKTNLSIHHIDYCKENAQPSNLIALCRSCHTKTNHNRNHWPFILRDLLEARCSV